MLKFLAIALALAATGSARPQAAGVQAAEALPEALTLVSTGSGINASGSLLVTATGPGTPSSALRWTVDGVPGGNGWVGTLKDCGNRAIYRAPARTGTHVIQVASGTDSARTASLQVTVRERYAQVANPALTVNVREVPYLARGDGATDDTRAIQRAIDAMGGTGGTVRIPAGTYLIDLATTNGRQGLTLRSDMTLSLEAGAVLRARPSSLPRSFLLYLGSVRNVNILGGTLLGDRDSHLGTTGEWGMGIGIDGRSSRVVLEGVTIKNCWGDGIYVTGSASEITLAGVVADGNRRQGLSVVAVDGLVVRDSTFTNTAGTAPQNGIDIEPEPGQSATGIRIFNCILARNAGGGLQSGPAVANVRRAFFGRSIFMGNVVKENGGYGISVSASDGIIVADNVVTDTRGYGILARTGATNTLVTGNRVMGSTLDGFWFNLCEGTRVVGNTSTGNKGRGINNKSTSGALLADNAVSGNGTAP